MKQSSLGSKGERAGSKGGRVSPERGGSGSVGGGSFWEGGSVLSKGGSTRPQGGNASPKGGMALPIPASPGFWALRLLLLLPFFALLYVSLQSAWRYPALWSEEAGLQHWSQGLRSGEGLLGSLGLSLLLSISVALVCTALGFAVSGAIAGRPRPRRWLALAYLPYLIAPVVLAAMLQVYFVRLGWSGTLTGVLLAQLLFVFPYAVLYFSGFWTARLKHTLLTARTLGAGRLQVLTRVLWPMGRNTLLMGAFQCFLLSWFEYGLTRLIGVGAVPTLTLRTLNYVQEGNPHLAAVASLLMVVPAALLIVLNRRFLFSRPL
jgi:putative spermidine/putrescine transport system permease protein